MCPAKSKEGVNKVSGFLNENMVFKTRVLRKGYTIVLQEAKIEKEKKKYHSLRFKNECHFNKNFVLNEYHFQYNNKFFFFN